MCPETVTVQKNLAQSGTRLLIRLSVTKIPLPMCLETVTLQRNLAQSGTRPHIPLLVIMRAHAMLCPAQAMYQAMYQAMTHAMT